VLQPAISCGVPAANAAFEALAGLTPEAG
jgi:hypothetical protein